MRHPFPDKEGLLGAAPDLITPSRQRHGAGGFDFQIEVIDRGRPVLALDDNIRCPEARFKVAGPNFRVIEQVSPGPEPGAPFAIASRGSSTTGSGSYFTRMRRRASSAASPVPAATRATTSPM